MSLNATPVPPIQPSTFFYQSREARTKPPRDKTSIHFKDCLGRLQ